MIPIIPHFAMECLEELKIKDNIIWPEINLKNLRKEEFKIVIQINGKKRDIIIVM